MVHEMTARDFAILCHGSQSYGDYLYEVHLDAVYNVLVEFGVTDTELLNAAYLHDVLEDTTLTPEFLDKLFPEVVELVWAVTAIEGHNRKQRNQQSYAKIILAPKAITLKLADRIANVRGSLKYKHNHFNMYKWEQEEFQNALRTHSASGDEPMWIHLNQLFEGKL